ncbi:MAG: hypothetical protein K2W95_36345 [Candidatus Obscuribacterales bacterium]|nr:hypothetical protein [Candidatus Obscuribacterales bacterium]
MNKKRWLLGGCLAVLVVVAGYTCLRGSAMKWPAFPEAHSAPVAVSEVLPDFAWRTGDVIPLTVYVKEAPGTAVDLKSLQLKGDAQLRGYTTAVEEQPDGTRLVKFDIEVQCFALKQPTWKVVPVITYREGEKKERKPLELPEFEIGSSNTYDKRKIERTLPNGQKIEMKDGHPKEQPFVYLVSNTWLWDIGYATLAVMVIAACGWVIHSRDKSKKVTGADKPLEVFSDEWAETVEDVKAAVALLQEGNTEKETYVRVQRGLLRLYRLDSVPLPEIQAAADGPCSHLMSLMHIIGFCHEVIYGTREHLDVQEVEKIAELLPEALDVAPHFKGIPDGQPTPFAEMV